MLKNIQDNTECTRLINFILFLHRIRNGKYETSNSLETNNPNMSISGFNSILEYVVSNWLFEQGNNNAIRMMFEENNIVDGNCGYCVQRETNIINVATDNDEIDNARFQRSTVAVPTVTTKVPVIWTELVSNEEVILNKICTDML